MNPRSDFWHRALIKLRNKVFFFFFFSFFLWKILHFITGQTPPQFKHDHVSGLEMLSLSGGIDWWLWFSISLQSCHCENPCRWNFVRLRCLLLELYLIFVTSFHLNPLRTGMIFAFVSWPGTAWIWKSVRRHGEKPSWGHGAQWRRKEVLLFICSLNQQKQHNKNNKTPKTFWNEVRNWTLII